MTIQWLGHACFFIESGNGTKIITDPFDPSIGYSIKPITADIVTISHNHYDHNSVKNVGGNPQVINKIGEAELKGIKIKGIQSFHDESKGAQRGINIIFSINVDNINVVHLGDLGHELTDEISKLGKVDVLLIPVGGTFTIDAKKAINIVNKIKPSIVIPMHYKTPHLKISIDTVDNFLKDKQYKKAKELKIEKDELPLSPEIWVLEL